MRAADAGASQNVITWRRTLSQGRDAVRSYHDLRASFIFGVICACFFFSSCVRADRSDAVSLASLQHAKPRADWFYEDARELVLVAAWAEHAGEPERAQRWYQRAYCFDPGSLYLRSKVEEHGGGLDVDVARCVGVEPAVGSQ